MWYVVASDCLKKQTIPRYRKANYFYSQQLSGVQAKSRLQRSSNKAVNSHILASIPCCACAVPY